MKTKDFLNRFLNYFLCAIRNFRSRKLFELMPHYCRGNVLDVGGWNFYEAVIDKRIHFESWSVLEVSEERIISTTDDRVKMFVGDGCSMDFQDESFETVLNIQVLEHVLDPIQMVREMKRVLKTDGHMILLIPQTSTLHMAPHHYYNFTRFWIERVASELGLQICLIKPLGGIWSTQASRTFYFFLQSARFQGMSHKECVRPLLFYFLFPFMIIFSLVVILISLIFSLGDLSEEPNNNLIVLKKI